MKSLLLALVVAGCGRVGFEARGDAVGDGATTDAAAPRGSTLVPALSGDNDLFGCSVALSQDGSVLAIGAYGEASAAVGVGGAADDNSAPGAGAVYIFERAGDGTWRQTAYVKASNTDQADVFGFAIALSADGAMLAVGAPDEDSAATTIDGDGANDAASSAGAVYVFRKLDTTWQQEAYVKAANAEAGDNFGVSVALSSDGGVLAVGAFTEDGPSNGSIDSGAVYTFVRGAAWQPQSYLRAPNADPGDTFGSVVALSDDGDLLAVAAPTEAGGGRGPGADPADDSQMQAGAVYTFRFSSTWLPESYLKASNTDGGDFFGNALALSGDGSTLAVAAEGEDGTSVGVGGPQVEGAGQAGAVYVLEYSDVWQQAAYVKATNTAADDRFGRSVALSHDGTLLVVGAALEDSAATGRDGDQSDDSATDAGAAYVYRRGAGAWAAEGYLKALATEPGAQLGHAVATSDGVTALGACRADVASRLDAGAVYVFE